MREVLDHARPTRDQLVVQHVHRPRRAGSPAGRTSGIARHHVRAEQRVLLGGAHALRLHLREGPHAAGDGLGPRRRQEPARATVHPDRAPRAVLQALVDQVEGRGAAAHHHHVAAGQRLRVHAARWRATPARGCRCAAPAESAACCGRRWRPPDGARAPGPAACPAPRPRRRGGHACTGLPRRMPSASAKRSTQAWMLARICGASGPASGRSPMAQSAVLIWMSCQAGSERHRPPRPSRASSATASSPAWRA